MSYYILDTLGEVGGDYAVIDDGLQGLGISYFMPACGERAAGEITEDLHVPMSDDYEGIALAPLLGNTQGYLMVSTPVKEVIESFSEGAEVEYLPFAVHDHRGRERSRDYWAINPIGTVDCLNLDASEINYFDKPGDPYHGDVISIRKYVLDPRKLEDVPALFRVREMADTYVVREDLAEALRQGGFENIELLPVEEQAAREPVSG